MIGFKGHIEIALNLGFDKTLLSFVRLLAVPFWIVERAREIAERILERGEKNEKRPTPSARSLQFSAFLLVYFAHPLDYPERDC